MAERAGFEPAVEFPLRQFSKLLLSATQPSLRCFAVWDIKYHLIYVLSSDFLKFLSKKAEKKIVPGLVKPEKQEYIILLYCFLL